LDDDQRQCDWDHRPEELIPELSASLRVGDDAVGIVINVSGDETGTHDGKEQKYPSSPASKESHGPNDCFGFDSSSLQALQNKRRAGNLGSESSEKFSYEAGLKAGLNRACYDDKP